MPSRAAGTSTSWPQNAAARSPSSPASRATHSHPPTSPRQSNRVCRGYRRTTSTSCSSTAARRAPHSRSTGGIEALKDLQRAGKVRFIGMSGTLPNLPAQIDLGAFDVFQIPYSAIQREHEALIATARAAGAGTVIRGGVARGAPSEEKSWDIRRLPEVAEERPRTLWETAALDDLLNGASRMEFMLRFTLSHPDRRHGEPGAPAPEPRCRTQGAAGTGRDGGGKATSECRRGVDRNGREQTSIQRIPSRHA